MMGKAIYNFKWIYLALTMLGVTQLTGVVNILTYVNVIMIAITFVWLVYDFLITRRFESLNTPYFDLLVLFIISYAITILLSLQYGIMGNVKTFLFSISQFMFLYFFLKSSFQEAMKSFQKIAVTVWLFSTVAAFMSIIMFFMRFAYIFEAAQKVYRVGVVQGRLWGVFWDPNYAGVLLSLALSVLFYLVMVNFFDTPWKKALAVFSAVIMYTNIVLTGSRAGIIALFISAALGAGYILPLFGKSLSLKRSLISIVAMLLCGVLAYCAISPVKALMVGINDKLYSMQEQSGHINSNKLDKYNPDLTADEIYMERDDVGGSDISNGRFSIWKSALEIVKEKPVFGAGNRSYVEFAKQNLPEGKIAKTGYTTHNDYVNLLMSSGIAGAAFMLLFIGFCVTDTIKALIAVEYKTQKFYLIWATASVAAIVAVSCLTLNLIWYYNDTISVIFWCTLGLLMSVVGCSSKETYCYKIANWITGVIKRKLKSKEAT